MRDILKPGLILMLYSLLAGSALAVVNITASPRIEQNRLEAEAAARNEVLPGMKGGFEERITGGGFRYWAGYAAESDDEPSGYVFVSAAYGYSSTIVIMAGVDRDLNIVGAAVISQQETPGLGTRITEVRRGETTPWFLARFMGKGAEDDLRVDRDGGTIEGITGATISSRAAAKAIEQGCATLHQTIGGSK